MAATNISLDTVMAKSSSQDLCVPVAEEGDDDEEKTVPYKYCYLAVMILDLIFGVSGLVMFGLLLLSCKDETLAWFIASILIIFLLLLIFSQYFGWRGYLHDVKSAKIFATFRSVVAVFAFFGMFQHTGDGSVFLLRVLYFIVAMVMAYVPMKFVQELKLIPH